MKNIIRDNDLKLPGGVYLPFGKSEQYNKFLMDYYIYQRKGRNYRFTCYNDYLENSLTYKIINSGANYCIIDQLGRKYIAFLEKNIIKFSLGFMNLSNVEEYILKAEIRYNSDPISVQELKSIIYEYFNWENINVYAEDVECVDDGKTVVTYEFHIRLSNGLHREDLKEFMSTFDLIIHNYSSYTRDIYNYEMKLKEKNSEIIIKKYDCFRNIDLDELRAATLYNLPFKYRFDTDKYKDSVINYYTNIYNWTKVAIEFGMKKNYSEEFFEDLQESVDNLITEDIMNIIVTGNPTPEEALSIDPDSFSERSIYQSIVQVMGLNIDNTQEDPSVQEIEVTNMDKLDPKGNEIISEEEMHIDTTNLEKQPLEDPDTNISEIENSISNMQTMLERM